MKEETQKQKQIARRSGFLLGAYAAAPVENFTHSRLKAFTDGVRELPFVSGLEIPFFKTGLIPFAGPQPQDQLAEGWNFAITALPGQMETMKDDLRFGLASRDHDGRLRAVDFIFRLFEETRSLMRARPDAHLLAIEIHSGPRPFSIEGADASLDAFGRSLEELTQVEEFSEEFGAVFKDKLVIEHCDAFHGAKGNPAKGFLTLDEEMQVAKSFGIGHVINWGRSAIEAHDPERPMIHLNALGKNVRGLIFSGAAAGAELYGSWQDSHAPFREAPGAETQASHLFLTKERAKECVARLPEDAFIGLKVQPLPRSLDVEERLKFLDANLRVLHTACDKI